MNKLLGKVTLITGGTSGIGAATAKMFYEEGASVVVTGASEQSVATFQATLPEVKVIYSDAGDAQAARRLVDSVVVEFGHIDVLFVNAGIGRVAPLADADEASFDKVFAVNVRGPYFLLKYAVPVLVDGGSIILTSSTGALRGIPGLSAYSASKAALRSVGLSLAAELAPRRIRVNTITPGPINTPILNKVGLTKEQMADFGQMIARVPLGRKGEPDEIAAAALYFASEDSRFTTGSELVVDGGMTLS